MVMLMKDVRASDIRCRQIRDEDIVAIADLLARGFPKVPSQHWSRALIKMSERERVSCYPKYGYLLESGAGPVGVILTIFSIRKRDMGVYTICNLSSWYVDPDYRGYASWLISAAVRHKDVTYINISAASHTWRTIEVQGFRRYSDGMILSFPRAGQNCARGMRGNI